MNTFVVSRRVISKDVIVRVVNTDGSKVRTLTEKEKNTLEGLLNNSEFYQHINQEEIK